MPVYFVDVLAATGAVRVDSTMRWVKAASFWNRDRLADMSFENGVGSNEPSRIGFMKRGQSRRHRERKESMSRPEYLERESQTAEQYRDQVSFVSFGRMGVGVVRARI